MTRVCGALGNHADNGAVLAILTITFPFFALVACGYLAARCKMLALSAATPVIASLVVDMVVASSLCIAISRLGPQIHSLWRRQRRLSSHSLVRWRC